MRRTLLATVAVVLVGALVATALAAVGAPPRTAGAGASAPAEAGGPAAADSGPFALAAERAEERRGDGYFEAAADRHRAAAAVRTTKRSFVRRRSGLYDPRMAEQVTRDLADRLDVEEERMRSALASVGRDTLSRGGAGGRRDWGATKRRVLAALADELDRPEGDIASAARNELEVKLSRGVTFGVVTAEGRELALACFDAPDRCDVAALRRTLRLDRRGPR